MKFSNIQHPITLANKSIDIDDIITSLEADGTDYEEFKHIISNKFIYYSILRKKKLSFENRLTSIVLWVHYQYPIDTYNDTDFIPSKILLNNLSFTNMVLCTYDDNPYVDNYVSIFESDGYAVKDYRGYTKYYDDI